MDHFSPERPLPAQEIEAISAEVAKHRENPEHRNLSGPELVKKSIQTYTASAPANDEPLPDYVSSAPPAVKQEIEHLLSVVFRDGILAANAEAVRSNPFVLDAFHDALTGKLYPELQKRGIVD